MKVIKAFCYLIFLSSFVDKELQKELLTQLDPTEYSSILYLDANDLDFIQFLARSAADVTVISENPEWVDRAVENCSEKNLTILELSKEKMGFRELFDLIITTTPQRNLQKIESALKNEGIFAMAIPLDSPLDRAVRKSEQEKKIRPLRSQDEIRIEKSRFLPLFFEEKTLSWTFWNEEEFENFISLIIGECPDKRARVQTIKQSYLEEVSKDWLWRIPLKVNILLLIAQKP